MHGRKELRRAEIDACLTFMETGLQTSGSSLRQEIGWWFHGHDRSEESVCRYFRNVARSARLQMAHLLGHTKRALLRRRRELVPDESLAAKSRQNAVLTLAAESDRRLPGDCLPGGHLHVWRGRRGTPRNGGHPRRTIFYARVNRRGYWDG